MPILRSDLDVVLTGNERDLLLRRAATPARARRSRTGSREIGWTMFSSAGTDRTPSSATLVPTASPAAGATIWWKGDRATIGWLAMEETTRSSAAPETTSILGDQETTFRGIATAHRSDPDVAAFLQTLGIVRLTAWVRFGADLPSDVVFGIDQEVVEGTDDPIHVAGADWMGSSASPATVWSPRVSGRRRTSPEFSPPMSIGSFATQAGT